MLFTSIFLRILNNSDKVVPVSTISSTIIIFLFSIISFVKAEETETLEVIKTLQKDLKTLEKAVYSQSSEIITANKTKLSSNDEDVLTRHLLKLSEIEKQFQDLTNKFEEINFKIDKLSSRLSKVQADNQLRFQNLEGEDIDKKVTSKKKVLPGSSQPQDLGAVSYKSSETNELTQQTQSIDTTGTVITEKFVSEEKILPNDKPDKQYEFATSFLKQGDYTTAERALREFVMTNPEHKMAGSAQYWYAETFRIRQLYTDAASAYLEGYQKYPKSEKAAINLLKLGVSLVQIGEKDQGCLMVTGVKYGVDLINDVSGFNYDKDSLNKLKKLLQMHKMPTVALGDFNVNTEEDSELFIYNDQEDLWDVAHLIGCADCKGTYYYSYGKSWSFLDTIFVSKQRNISYDTDSIRLHITEHNAYKDSGKPIRFNAKSKTGVSDHLPMVARIKIN